jgi:hypothetical protein
MSVVDKSLVDKSLIGNFERRPDAKLVQMPTFGLQSGFTLRRRLPGALPATKRRPAASRK